MPRFICVQCGTQYPDSAAPPSRCVICDEPRQYIRWKGQEWTTLEELRTTHRLKVADEAENITGIGMEPPFAITQRALLVQSPVGNILWDCIDLVNDEAVAEINKRGGLAGIAISHPHYYTTMLEWSEAFGGVPIHIHADDREWVQRSGPTINHWTGETLKLNDEMTLIRCGGHFEGGTVLHWSAGEGGKGALLPGDIVQVATDRKHVSFMYSYPNFIPLNATAVRRIAAALAPYEFDSIFGIYWDLKIVGNGKRQFDISVERYLRAIGG